MPGCQWLVVLAGVLVGIFWSDLRHRRVGNDLVVVAAVLGFAARGFSLGLSGVTSALMGLCVGFAVLILPYAVGVLGAADVKVAAALGAWLGPAHGLRGITYGTMAAGLLALWILLRSPKGVRRDMLDNLDRSIRLVRLPATVRRQKQHTVPLAAGLALGVALEVLLAMVR